MVAPGRASAGSPAHWRNPFGAWTPRFHARDEDPNASPRASEAADGAPPKLVMEGGAYLWDDSPWSNADRIASLVDGDPGRWRRVWLEVVDDVVLLAPGGRTAYSGPKARCAAFVRRATRRPHT